MLTLDDPHVQNNAAVTLGVDPWVGAYLAWGGAAMESDEGIPEPAEVLATVIDSALIEREVGGAAMTLSTFGVWDHQPTIEGGPQTTATSLVCAADWDEDEAEESADDDDDEEDDEDEDFFADDDDDLDDDDDEFEGGDEEE